MYIYIYTYIHECIYTIYYIYIKIHINIHAYTAIHALLSRHPLPHVSNGQRVGVAMLSHHASLAVRVGAEGDGLVEPQALAVAMEEALCLLY
jgi:hypothetical protein